eukprot:s3081_g1.t1
MASKVEPEPPEATDPFQEILQRMETHFSSQGDLLAHLNQQLQKARPGGPREGPVWDGGRKLAGGKPWNHIPSGYLT